MNINLKDFLQKREAIIADVGDSSLLSINNPSPEKNNNVISAFKIANKKQKKQLTRKKHTTKLTNSVVSNSDDPFNMHEMITNKIIRSPKEVLLKKEKLQTIPDKTSKEYEKLLEEINDIESVDNELDYYVNSARFLNKYNSLKSENDDRQSIQLGKEHTSELFKQLQNNEASDYRDKYIQSISDKHLSFSDNIQLFKKTHFSSVCPMCNEILEYTDCLNCGVDIGTSSKKFTLGFKESQDIDTKNISCHNQKEQAFDEILADIQGFPKKRIGRSDLKWACDIISSSCQKDLITGDYIKAKLKAFSRSDLYDFVAQIYREIHQFPKKRIDPACLAAMDQMYDDMKEVEELAKQNIQSSRKNSLWAIYIVRKFLQMFQLHEYLPMLTSLKAETVQKQDEIFKEIARLLSWRRDL